MTNRMHLALLLLLGATVGACSAKERVCSSIYEGLQAREQIIYETSDPIPKEHPRYDEYQRERDEILNKNKTENNR